MFLKQKVGKPEKPGEPGTIRTHDLELLNSLSTYLRQEDVDEAEDEVVVQRGPLVQQDGLDVLQESVRLKKHHDELPVDLLQGKRLYKLQETNYKRCYQLHQICHCLDDVTVVVTDPLLPPFHLVTS